MTKVPLARLSGTLHNCALDTVSLSDGLKKRSPEAIFNTILNFVNERGRESSSNQLVSLDYAEAENLFRQYKENPDNVLAQMHKEGKLTDTQFHLLTAATLRVQNMAENDNKSMQARLIYDDLTGIMEFAEHTKMQDNEKDGVVGMISVLQHSHLYWANDSMNKMSPWHSSGDTPTDYSRLNRVDALGFLLGWWGGGILTGIALGTFFSAIWSDPQPPRY